MKHRQVDNINYVIGWLCGAAFLAAPVVAAVYLLRHRRRPALQALMICVMALPCIIGTHAVMIAGGIQHRRFAWIGLNVLVFLMFPLLATGITAAMPWPRPSRPHSGRRTSR
jgi:uncharacterized membrane protein